jgi:hypothetical protein
LGKPPKLLGASAAFEVRLASLIRMAEKAIEVKVISLKVGLLSKDMLTGKLPFTIETPVIVGAELPYTPIPSFAKFIY